MLHAERRSVGLCPRPFPHRIRFVHRSSSTGPSRSCRRCCPRQLGAEEEVRNRPKPLRHPFWSGVYTFPFQPAIGIPCLTLAIGVTALLIAITSISRLHPAQVLFACALAAVGAVATALFASVSALTIVRTTAMGQDKLDQWPEPTLVDWLLQALYILNSLTLSLLPTLLGLAVLGGQSAVAWAGLALVPLVFPLILLSMLEEGSAMVPYSGSILAEPGERVVGLVDFSCPVGPLGGCVGGSGWGHTVTGDCLDAGGVGAGRDRGHDPLFPPPGAAGLRHWL